jgi:hypothetical protein
MACRGLRGAGAPDHVVNEVVEWPVAAFGYSAMVCLGWHVTNAYRLECLPLSCAVIRKAIRLGSAARVGGTMTHREIEAIGRCRSPLRRKTRQPACPG